MKILSADVLEEIRYRVVQGFDNRETVFEWVLSNCPAQLGILSEQNGGEDLYVETNTTLRDSIDHVFREKAKEMESWPSLTDCDRLRAAFDALDKQGIVALECPGLTQDDSIPIAADVAAARDELGGAQAHGYCFFTWNDMARAIDGEGLSLAYGTFKEATASPNLGQQVGAMVLAACRDAGLDVEWTEDPEAYVEMPRFRWQRRLIATQETDIQNFLAGWEMEMRAGYVSPNEMLATLEDRASAWFETFSDFGPSLRARLRDHTEHFLEKEQALEATWFEATINDRIASVFEELNRRGVLAREALGMTIQDGWGYAGAEAESSHRGAIFFHHEDVIDGVDGNGLLLAYGTIGSKPSEDDAATAVLAQEVVTLLQMNGIPCSWNRSVAERIRIAPFAWRRRRWTKPPTYQLVQPPEQPKGPSLFARVFGTKKIAANRGNERTNVLARRCGVVVRAKRTGDAFNLPRSRQLRAAWKALGNSGEPQVGNPGIPHIFIRPGSWFSLAPQLATINLRGEKEEIFNRGARSKAVKRNNS